MSGGLTRHNPILALSIQNCIVKMFLVLVTISAERRVNKIGANMVKFIGMVIHDPILVLFRNCGAKAF